MKIKLAIEFEMEKPENELDYIFISEIKNKINTVVESNIIIVYIFYSKI